MVYAEQTTTQSSVESSLQLSVRKHRQRTTSKILQRISCHISSSPTHSNQSSIYAEIDTTRGHTGDQDYEDRTGDVFFISNDSDAGTALENSFFSTLSSTSSEGTLIQEPYSLDIPDKVKEALFLPYLPGPQELCQCPDLPTYRTPSPDFDTGWVDNIIYEGSAECLNEPIIRSDDGIQTLRPQPSGTFLDLAVNRERGFTL